MGEYCDCVEAQYNLSPNHRVKTKWQMDRERYDEWLEQQEGVIWG